MARIDKSNFSFRALAGTVLTGLRTVDLDAGGSVVPAAGTASVRGIICLPGTIAAGQAVSVFKQAEIVEFGGSAATDYYAVAGGSVDSTAGGQKVGHTVEGNRLIVNVSD